MTKLPEKELLDGSKTPRTKTVEMKTAFGKLHDFLADLLGTDSSDKETARQVLGIDLPGLNKILLEKADKTELTGKVDRTELEALQNEIAKKGVPVGSIDYFAMTVPPSGYLKADGGTVSRTSYPDLFDAIGITFGEGDGTTTFRLPDLRGEFVRGWDDGREVDTGRVLGSAQGDAIRNITGTISDAYGGWNFAATGAFDSSMQSVNLIGSQYEGAYGHVDLDVSRVVPTADENRPRNVALLACIKAFDAASNPGLIDMTELANEVSGKADRNLSNVLPAGIDTCVRWGIPDYKRKVSLSESDFPYTVGKPGLFTLGTGGGNNDKVYVNDDLVFYTYVNEAYGMSNGCFVDSGDVLTISLSGAGERNFNFYPFKGVK